MAAFWLSESAVISGRALPRDDFAHQDGQGTLPFCHRPAVTFYVPRHFLRRLHEDFFVRSKPRTPCKHTSCAAEEFASRGRHYSGTANSSGDDVSGGYFRGSQFSYPGVTDRARIDG